MEKDYKFLKVGVKIFKVLAWVSLGVGVLSAVIIFVGGGTPDAPRVTGFVGLLLGIIYLFVFLTVSEVVELLLEIRGKVVKNSSV